MTMIQRRQTKKAIPPAVRPFVLSLLIIGFLGYQYHSLYTLLVTVTPSSNVHEDTADREETTAGSWLWNLPSALTLTLTSATGTRRRMHSSIKPAKNCMRLALADLTRYSDPPSTETTNTTDTTGSNRTSLTSAREECLQRNSEWIENQENTTVDDYNSTHQQQRIPFIIHQTGSTRCIPTALAEAMSNWRNLSMYQYYFHDDDAVWRLLNQEWPEFPYLKKLLRCLNSMTAVSDIWRLLVLWEYGGIYSDLDSIPNSWTPATIHPDDDAYMVVENYDAPSQYFMAVTPRHPLMFYSIHTAMSNILASRSVPLIDAAFVTGPFALLDGLTLFMLDVGQNVGKPVSGGFYQGANNRSVRIDGYGRQRSGEIILREAIKRRVKNIMYDAMNMTHFSDVTKARRNSGLRGRSCLAVLYDIDVGPPSWFVPSDSEDRVTIGGPS